jgi:uncharacterized protein (DUF4415 family)
MRKRRPNPYATDADNPELTAADFARMRPAQEVLPALKRGRPKLEQPKVPVTLRVDADVLAQLKAAGPGWQTRANAALRAYAKRARCAVSAK